MSGWDERYNIEDYVYGTEPNEFIREFVQTHGLSGQVLAIAEGEGRNAVYLAECGCSVEVWDLSAVGLKKAEALAAERHVTITTKVIDLAQADWQADQYDAVICVFGHFPEKVREAVLAGVKKTVKPGGLFVTEVYDHGQLALGTGGPKERSMLYMQTDFDRFSDWSFLHREQRKVERQEGLLHRGRSSVIQVAARKPLK